MVKKINLRYKSNKDLMTSSGKQNDLSLSKKHKQFTWKIKKRRIKIFLFHTCIYYLRYELRSTDMRTS